MKKDVDDDDVSNLLSHATTPPTEDGEVVGSDDELVTFFDKSAVKPQGEMIKEIFQVAIPIFCARISYYGMAATDAVLIGHCGSQYLAATSLSE